MRLPLCLNSIFNVSILFIPILLFSSVLHAEFSNFSYKASAGFYNPKNATDNNAQENFKNYFNLGLQYGITESLDISLDSYFSDEVSSLFYMGGSLDYTYDVSDDYDVFTRIGGDVIDHSFVPKVGFGISSHVSKALSLTLESTMRSTGEFSEYQFAVGMRYKLGVKDNSNVATAEYLEEDALEDRILESTDKINKEYIVVKGDTLWSIANRFNQDLAQLINKNKKIIHNADLIYPEMRLIL